MLLLLVSTLFIVPALLGWGFLSEKTLKITICDGLAGKLLGGVFTLSILFTCIAFWGGISIYAETFVLATGIFFFGKEKIYKNFWTFLKNSGLVFYSAIFFILFAASFAPFILDYFGYYKPTIQWISEYGLVKGISNLDLTLGQMSVWHIFQAGFSGFSDTSLRINAILLIVYLIYIFENKDWFHLLFIPAMLFFVQSPSPDLPSYIFSLIIIQEILAKKQIQNGLFAFSIFAFTIKMTVIWLPIFTFLLLIYQKKISVNSFILGAFIFIFFMFKNIWVFGYPIFPLTIFDFNIPWKPNYEMMKMSSEYAILKTYDAQYSLQQIRNFAALEKLQHWFFLPGIKSFFNIGLVVFLFLYGIFAGFKKEKLHYLLWISLVLKSILVISFSAQYRFFLEVFPVIIIAVFFTFNFKKTATLFFSVGSLVAILFLSNPEILKIFVPSFRLGNTMRKFEFSQLYKPLNYKYQSYDRFKIGNLKVNVSKKYPFNFDTPLPAVSESFMFDYQRLGIFPQLKDSKNIKKGFIWKKLNKQEKTELNSAIKTIQNNYK